MATLPVPATGASVDESRVTKILYVDPAHTEAADDDKHGVADAPFATLGFACQAAARAKSAGVGVKLVLATGTYREAAEIPAPAGGKPDTEAPLVIEAAEREQAVIDGADTEGWSPSTWKVEENHWTHPWPFRRTAPARPAAGVPAGATGEAYRHGDLILVNGTLLKQVNTAADLAPGCFWGMLPAPNGGRHNNTVSTNVGTVAVVQPPPETELAGSIIQVGARARGLTISGRRNVVVRGLLVQHAAEPDGAGERTAGVVLDGCSNVLVEDVLSQWNDGVGLAILGRAGASASTDFTLRRVRLLHNGGSGLAAANVRNVLAEDSETSFNNFRGDWAGWVDPQGPAGVKAESVRGSTWRRQHAVGNACRGMWWAGGNTDVTVEEAVLRENFVSGLFLDNDPGPAAVSRCLVAGTKAPPGGGGPENPAACAGCSVAGTPDVTLQSNVFADNAGTQLGLGEPPGKPLAHAERHTYRHNVFYSAEPAASLLRAPAADGSPRPEPDFYYATLDSRENCFWNPVQPEGFEGYVYRAGSRRVAAQYTSHAVRLEEWQAGLLKEAGSLWQDPRFVDPAEGDYRLRKTSPVLEWDLPSDEETEGQ